MFCGSEEEFHFSIEQGSMGMGLVCQVFIIVGVNKTISDMVGYTKDELVGKTFEDLTFRDDLRQEIELGEKLN